MSTIAISPSTLSPSARGASRPDSRGRSARVGLGAVTAAALANVGVYLVGGALVGYDPRFLPLANVGATAVSTLLPAVVTALLYAALLRSAHRPARSLAPIAAAAFVVTLLPDLAAIPATPDAPAGPAALVAMHLAAAGAIIGLLTALARRPAR
jgi:hypothetical protein